jgi:hypothetical protein
MRGTWISNGPGGITAGFAVLIGSGFGQKGKMSDYQDSAADFGDNAQSATLVNRFGSTHLIISSRQPRRIHAA